MLSNAVILLSLVIFLPTAGAFVLLFLPKEQDELLKRFALGVTAAVFLLTVFIAIPLDGPAPFMPDTAGMQQAFSLKWIPSFNIYYALGIDGISFPLVLLTSFLSMLAMWASWPIQRQVKGYCVLFLLLETGMLGVFMSLDFFLFYVFWEVMLLPMYFLIGVWGGPKKEYAAIKFFLFTLVGSVLMLVALLMLYFSSDLKVLSHEQLYSLKTTQHVLNPQEYEAAITAKEHQAELAKTHENVVRVHTFNLVALAEIGQAADSPFDDPLLAGRSIQWWAFLLLLIGFLVKVPAVPMHTWLPDAHVEAPTPIAMILAGVLLKMGGYGIIRVCYPICPDGGYDLAWLVCGLGLVSMVYGAFAAMAQKDFKRLVAYSSVSHMGYVVLGLGAWSAAAGTGFNADYWKMGMNGAMFQMLAHGLSSAGMFFLVGVVYDRVHHRNLDQFGGLFAKMPVYSGLAMGIFFAALGLPGLCGFIGEVFVVLSVWTYSMAAAVVAASVVILTAGYILWTIQRVYLGAEYRGPHPEALKPATRREVAIAAPLLALAILFGVYPQAIFNYMSKSVDKTADDLAAWTQSVKEPRLRQVATGQVGDAVPLSLRERERVIASGATAGLPSSAALPSLVTLLDKPAVAPSQRSSTPEVRKP